jgi:hypothetical protein
MRTRDNTKVLAARVISPQDKIAGIESALQANLLEDQVIVTQLAHYREQLRQNRQTKRVLQESLRDYLRRNRGPQTSTTSGTFAEEDSEDSSSESADSDCYPTDASNDSSADRSTSQDLVELGRPPTHDPIRKRQREPEERLPTG